MSACSFTWEHYLYLLRDVSAAGYRFVTFGDPVAPDARRDRLFYMRHDIDVDPYAALAMARLEAEAGARATYFFLPTAPYYNLASVQGRSVLREIIELGGEIQLHFDAAPHAECEISDIEAEIARQADWLSSLTGQPVSAVSFHRPAPQVMDRDLVAFESTYAPRYFREMRYISDSAGEWRQGCVCKHLPGGGPIHCLIHPIWWGQQMGDVAGRLAAYYGEVVQRYATWLSQEIRSYAAPPTPVVNAELASPLVMTHQGHDPDRLRGWLAG